MQRRIARGAEAEILLDSEADTYIVKSRIKKGYRLPQLDESIRRSRNRKEAKIISKLPEDIGAPRVISSDAFSITMEYIEGDKVRDILDKNIGICALIGEKIAHMHNAGIIHGDLTTSNMIHDGKDVRFIDFGLSFFSDKVEDKAVDIHLLRQALESRHHRICKEAFSRILGSYSKHAKDSQEVMKRYVLVEKRGRNKQKI